MIRNSRKNRVLISGCLFLLVFLFFFARNHYYETANLELVGSFTEGDPVFVSWDSGAGFNINERSTYQENFQLPQLLIKGIRIEKADFTEPFTLKSAKVITKNRIINLTIVDESKATTSYVATGIDFGRQSLSVLLICVQFLLALLLAFLFYEMLLLPQKLNKSDWRSTFYFILIEDRHWIFWTFFLTSNSMFGCWLVGQWPGFMTYDSLGIWDQSIRLVWDNWHPWPNQLYFLALRQLSDTPAVVAIFQIAATASLGSYIFYYSLKKGARYYVVLPFFGLFVLSVPVGLYNITLWKDIPFSLITVFFAFLFFKLWISRIAGEPCRPTPGRILLLSLCLVFFEMMRHNGVIFILFIPFLGAVIGLFPLKTGLAAFTLAILVVLNYGVGSLLGVHQRTHYDQLSYLWKAGPVYGLFSNPTGYYSTDPELDQKIMSRHVDLNFLRDRFSRAVPDPIFMSNKINLSQDVLRDLNALYYKRVPDNLAVLMGDRTYCFVTALLPTHEAETWGTTLGGPGWRENLPWEQVPNVASLVRVPKNDFLARTQATIIEKTTNYTGILSGRAIFWNNLMPLLLLTAVSALYKWIPGSALFSLIILVQVPFLFLTVHGCFRYYYFVYLAGFFVVPLVSAELHQSRLLKKIW